MIFIHQIFWLVTFPSAPVCICDGPMTLADQYTKADGMFTGDIISLDTVSFDEVRHVSTSLRSRRTRTSIESVQYLSATFIVRKSFKGGMVEGDTIQVLTYPTPGGCGIDFFPLNLKPLLPDGYFRYLVTGGKFMVDDVIRDRKTGLIKDAKAKELKNAVFTDRCFLTKQLTLTDEEKIAKELNKMPSS